MSVRVSLLGGFGVTVDDVAVPAGAWSRRHAASLVKLLALAPGRRLHREQVMDALWPGLPPDAAAPRLHKAAHYARRALGDDDALVLRHDAVALLPGADVRVDVEELRTRGPRALAAGTADAAEDALEAYGGPLLPEDVYEPWTAEARESTRLLVLDLLRRAGRWEALLAEEPADEQAHLALARAAADRGDRHGALRQLERLEQALGHELGAPLPAEARELRARLQGPAPASPAGRRLFGRREVGDRVREVLRQAEQGHGATLILTGPAGVGKSAVLDLVEALATRQGWRHGRGTASAVEGAWP